MTDYYTQPDDELILTIRIEEDDYADFMAFLAEDPRIQIVRESGLAFDRALSLEVQRVVQVIYDHRLHLKLAAEAMEVGKDVMHQLIAAAISMWVVKRNLKNQKAIEDGEKEPIILDADGHRMKVSTKLKKKS